MRRRSVRNFCAIHSLVHNQLAVSSLHSVSRCWRVSHPPQCLQGSHYTSLMTCRHSLVGTISCITMYQMDAISSDTEAVSRFFTPASIVCPHVVALSSFLDILSSLLPLYVEYCRLVIWMSGAFHHSRRVIYRPCSAHIDIDPLTSSVSVLCEGHSP